MTKSNTDLENDNDLENYLDNDLDNDLKKNPKTLTPDTPTNHIHRPIHNTHNSMLTA